MGVFEKFLASDWGQARIGSKSYPVRLLVTIAGATLWLGTMLLETGMHGVAEVWTSMVYLGPLLVICSMTRTVTARQLISLFFLGGFMMGVALLIIDVAIPGVSYGKLSGVGDWLVVPPLEEACKIVPVLFLLWRWRKSRVWSLAATDVLLMAAFCGAGFGLVENSYIRSHMHWAAALSWLPTTSVDGPRIDPGHALRTTLAGASIGLALLIRSRSRLARIIASTGFMLSTIDHIAMNYLADNPNRVIYSLLNAVTMNGYLVLWMFFLTVVVVLAADLYIARTAIPDLPELQRPNNLQSKRVFAVQKRALAHAVFNYRQTTGLERSQAICMAAVLDAWFQNNRFIYNASRSALTQ